MLRAPNNGRQVLAKVMVDLPRQHLGISNVDPGAVPSTQREIPKHLHHTRSCRGNSISLLQINNALRRAAQLRLTNRGHTFAARSDDETQGETQLKARLPSCTFVQVVNRARGDVD